MELVQGQTAIVSIGRLQGSRMLMRWHTGHRRAICTLFSFLLAFPAYADDASRLKAAYIEKLTRFIEWPERQAPGQAFVLCQIGGDTLDGALHELARLVPVKGLELQVRQLGAGQQVLGCHAAFISNAMSAQLPALLEQLGASPILTIGDSEGYAARGVMVNFYVEEGRLRFEINMEAANAAGLRVGARVLKLARIVAGGN